MSTTLSGFAQWLAKQVFEAGPEVDEQEDGRPGALIDLQCGKTCFNDVPARMRSELWLSQLHREGKGAEAARRYPVLLAQVAQVGRRERGRAGGGVAGGALPKQRHRPQQPAVC